MRRAFVVHHAKSGVVALNVVSAAVQGRVRVAFARDRAGLVRELAEAKRRGEEPIAGWSFYSPDFWGMAEDLRFVKERVAGVTHVAGGVHASAEPLQTLRAGFDLAAIGEGETTAVRLLADGQDPRTIPGLAWLEGGRLHSNGPGERRPLDDFPAFNAPAGKWNAIEITRGCVYACSFCQTPFMFKARFRHRSVQNVREHIRWMKRDGIRYMRFLTPTCLSYGSSDASVNLEAVEDLLAAVREEMPAGSIYFGTFPSECRPEHVTAASLRVLRKYVDNRSLVIGGQSGSARLLLQTHRGHGVEEIVSAVRLAVAAGFRPDVDFLLGLPGETDSDRAESLALARRLVELGARIHSHAFMPLPGTPLRGAVPSAIDAATMREMARMESGGSMYGQWRRHRQVADQLITLRAGPR
ncbi:MAG TPA: TIGR04013 family B12-binding domain/radical SAM domain-containing protein [Myxococcales bacterium]|jgi:B12-binding domain/radical SAM domain protein|nr:TIGR04013 family B12-binding domain/radical SAM domain-containing protein [Myxococcales bacterium]